MKNKDVEQLLIESGKSFVPSDLNKTKERFALAESLPKTSSIKRNFKIAYVAAALSIIIIACAITLYFAPSSTVYFDVNPSVSFTLNAFDRVIGYDSLNGDSLDFDGKAYINKSSNEALYGFIDYSYDYGYLENGELLISTSASIKNAEKLQQNALAKLNAMSVKVHISASTLTKDDIAAAKENGVPPGKYKLIREIKAYSEDFTTAELNEMSVAELKALLAKVSNASKNQDKQNNNGKSDSRQDNSTKKQNAKK